MNLENSSLDVIIDMLRSMGFSNDEVEDLSIQDGMNLVWLQAQLLRDPDDE